MTATVGYLLAALIQGAMAALNAPAAFADDPSVFSAVSFGFCSGLAFASLISAYFAYRSEGL